MLKLMEIGLLVVTLLIVLGLVAGRSAGGSPGIGSCDWRTRASEEAEQPKAS